MVGGVKVYYAVLLALVMGVGCGGDKEKATPKAEPKEAEVKKPLTKEESAKVIEANEKFIDEKEIEHH